MRSDILRPTMEKVMADKPASKIAMDGKVLPAAPLTTQMPKVQPPKPSAVPPASQGTGGAKETPK